MPSWSRRIPFRDDIAGIIEIRGSSLYGRTDTLVRELIQYAHDRLMRRRKLGLAYQGRIDIEQDSERHTLRFSDDGVGLSPDEVERCLGAMGIELAGLTKRGRPVQSRDEVAAGITAAAEEMERGSQEPTAAAEKTAPGNARSGRCRPRRRSRG